jgi:hypothetical protein
MTSKVFIANKESTYITVSSSVLLIVQKWFRPNGIILVRLTKITKIRFISSFGQPDQSHPTKQTEY